MTPTPLSKHLRLIRAHNYPSTIIGNSAFDDIIEDVEELEQARQTALEDARAMKACWDAACNELHEFEQARQRAEAIRIPAQALVDDIRKCYPEGLESLDGVRPYIEALEAALAQTKETK